jgi:hypothetical protein
VRLPALSALGPNGIKPNSSPPYGGCLNLLIWCGTLGPSLVLDTK